MTELGIILVKIAVYAFFANIILIAMLLWLTVMHKTLLIVLGRMEVEDD